MKNLVLLTFTVILALSCGKDQSSNCDFIGSWCSEPYSSSTGCILTIEFRENGELYQQGTTFFTWESSDCKTIDIINKGTSSKSAEYKVKDVTSTTMLLDIGVGYNKYYKIE